MCTRYITPEIAEIEREWEISRRAPNRWWEGHLRERVVMPLYLGPYIKPQGQLELGQWGMIPPGSPTRKPTQMKDSKATKKRLETFNARVERVAKAWTYREPWRRAQRCLIPAASVDEPYWGYDDMNIWWRLARADGKPWALAGLWSEWTDPETGEIVGSYTMLTQNCDGHPVYGCMHKPDPKLPSNQQDKRAVVPIERADWDAWLHGSPDQAMALIRMPPAEAFAHGPADPRIKITLDTKPPPRPVQLSLIDDDPAIV